MKWVPIFLILVACSSEPELESNHACFRPQRDITAYEVALVFEYAQKRSSRLLDDHPELKRHTVRC